MLLQEFDYIALPARTGDRVADTAALLLANGCPKTLAHVQRVAEVCTQLADRFGLDREACIAAGLLHDVSAIIRRSDMLPCAQRRRMPLYEAEKQLPFLLHQRLSAVIAAEHFGVTDAAILSAIECHTTLKAEATPTDMVLFIADKLAWDQEGTPPYEQEVRAALAQSLPAACLAYMRYCTRHGRVLYPHTWWLEALVWLEQAV